MQSAGNFPQQLEGWRQSLGLGHNAFARHLGISGPYWHQMRTGIRQPSRTFVGAVLSKAPEPWKSALERAYMADVVAV